MKHYPKHFRTLLLAVLVLLFFSGLLLLPGALMMRLEWDVPWSLPTRARVWTAASHAASYLATLFLLGALWTNHMRAGWMRWENIKSGTTLLGAFAVLALSGLGLYYAGEEALGRLALSLHVIAGLALPLILGAHILGARQAQARAHRPASIQCSNEKVSGKLKLQRWR